MVCQAIETLAHIGQDTALTRRVILDAETHEEIDLLDVGSHVVHNQPGQAYTIGQVVDATERQFIAIVIHLIIPSYYIRP